MVEEAGQLAGRSGLLLDAVLVRFGGLPLHRGLQLICIPVMDCIRAIRQAMHMSALHPVGT